MNRSETAIALVEANRRMDAYSAARAEGFTIGKARVIAQYGRLAQNVLAVIDSAGSAGLVESGRAWAIVNDVSDVTDLPGGRNWVD